MGLAGLATPAIAQQLTSRPGVAIALSAALAVMFTWAGLAVAFWQPYPVSFFITTFAFAAYVLVRLAPTVVRARGSLTHGGPPTAPKPWRAAMRQPAFASVIERPTPPLNE